MHYKILKQSLFPHQYIITGMRVSLTKSTLIFTLSTRESYKTFCLHPSENGNLQQATEAAGYPNTI